MNVIFFNPYADPDVKGAARRIEFLSNLLKSNKISYQTILKREFFQTEKSALEKFLSRIHLGRIAYFKYILRISNNSDVTVISEVIFSPTWRRNVILTIHDLKVYDRRASRGGFLRVLAYSLFAKMAKRIVVVSNSVRDDLIKYCGVHASRIHVVPNGISNSRLLLAKEYRRATQVYDFIYVSSFAKHKRHSLMIRAAPNGSRICFIGRDLGTLDEVMIEVQRRSDEIQVDILGNIDTDDQLFSLLGSARCGVFPSVFEGFGIPLLEYAAAGLFVIATEIPPFKELAEYVDRFVPPDNEEALRDALAEALSNSGEQSPRTIETVLASPYCEDRIASKFIELLTE